MRHGQPRIEPDELRIVPANVATCGDLQTVFGARGDAAICQCQRYKLAPKEAFKHHPAGIRAARLEEQTRCGDPSAATTTGLVAYLGDEPVGWCAVEPRVHYAGLLRVYRTPWEGRSEDRQDPTVWAVTCFVVRAGYRKRGVSRALARAAVEHARSRGARALEGYPMRPEAGKDVIWGEIHVGAQSVFADAGFRVVSSPGIRRVVMRIDF
jgi:GNAT superfamily N-acetyltransferase